MASSLSRNKDVFEAGLHMATKAVAKTDPVDDFKEMVKRLVEPHLASFDVWHNQVLVAHFVRNKIGSLIVAAQTQKEDQFQGKVGLVLKLGPSAFVEEPGVKFYGVKAKVGDWVLYRNSDGFPLDFCPPGSTEKILCRLVGDADLKGSLARPDMVW